MKLHMIRDKGLDQFLKKSQQGWFSVPCTGEGCKECLFDAVPAEEYGCTYPLDLLKIVKDIAESFNQTGLNP